MTLKIAPSLLAADFACLREEIQRIEQAGADWLHLDVMDGHFVPNITFGPPLVASIRKVTRLFLDAHLMISCPENFITAFAEAGAELITVHVETLANPDPILRQIKSLGLQAGLSLKPATPLSEVIPYLPTVDLLLFMTVEPGFGGQVFMPEVLPKLREARSLLARQPHKPWLQVDGGITAENSALAVAAGANVIVAGTAIFGHSDPASVIRTMKAAG